MHRRGRVTATICAASVAAVVMTGCQAQGCPGWAGYDSPTEAAEAADAVVIGHVQEQVGTAEFLGARGNIWTIDVDEWMKGDGPAQIDVLSTPSQCGPSDDPYLGLDPFESAVEDDASAVFLTDEGGRWRAISPGQGIVETADGGVLPAEWPTP